MDGNKKYKTSIGIIVGLTALSVGLFSYQNFFYGKDESENTAIIFVANKDIQAKTKIDVGMFDMVEVPLEGALKTYVADISTFVGKELKGGVLKGEPLTSVRINTKESNLDENLDLELQPDYVGEIGSNDNVKVYVMLTDKHTGEATVKLLFSNKKILQQSKTSNDGGLINLDAGTPETSKIMIKVTDEELKNYYVAKASGKIIVAKVTDLDITEIVSEGIPAGETVTVKEEEKFNPDSDEAKNSYVPTDNKDNSLAVMSYTVKDGDTIDSICQQFKTSKDKLINLNNDKTEYQAGDVIVVPAI